jgi:RHS repeat-associated protein
MQIASTRLAAENNHRFPGQYYDAETGLHQNYFRDYEASLGRYVQRDPIGLRGGINVFGYVGGRPIVGVDPLGLRSLNKPPSRVQNPYKDPRGGLDTLTNNTLDFICNIRFSKEMTNMNEEIEQKKAETSQCDTVYYMITFSVTNHCKHSFRILFSPSPIKMDIVCNLDGYGINLQCGFVKGSFKGTK